MRCQTLWRAEVQPEQARLSYLVGYWVEIPRDSSPIQQEPGQADTACRRVCTNHPGRAASIPPSLPERPAHVC